MLEKTNQSVHSMYFFLFSEAIVRWSSYIWYAVQYSCNRSRNTQEMGSEFVLFCFNAGYLKRLIPFYDCTPTVNYFFITAVWLRCHLKLLLLLPFFPFFPSCSIVQLSHSQCQFHFSVELQKKPLKFRWYFLIQFSFRHVWWINIGFFFIADGFHTEAIISNKILYFQSTEQNRTEQNKKKHEKQKHFLPRWQ